MNRLLLTCMSLVVTGALSLDCALAGSREPGAATASRFEPEAGQVLVFIGQDNASVGGNGDHRDGYVDHVGVPAGVTHYIYFVEGATNKYGFTFDTGTVDGLNEPVTWGAGPMCMRCYLESDAFDELAIHLSISMEFNSEDSVASGEYDHLISELADFLREFSHIPFYIRIGYEFDGAWNNYDPENFKAAWRRIVDHLRAENIDNFATVMGASRSHIPRKTWDLYWPGDDYVDWLGYSFWYFEPSDNVVLGIAREKDMPVMIAEAAPRGFYLSRLNKLPIYDWYEPLFAYIEANNDVIRALAYINAYWERQPMWKGSGWGDTRVQANDAVRQWWIERTAGPGFLHGPEGLYKAIGFDSGR